ncbi:hypothetical protein EMPS_08132 [Entomortierella parvispora]|uniref:Uncharacterized protein n=1 Tax=Entomortierella parvispora TaxID=205924 RepID=A0A9P3LZ13_9FUNG|nr:hypothetical protein EMPS_08132 [Entomortierella parvispora]
MAGPPSASTLIPVQPSEHVFVLILEQFWGDGISKREIRTVYTTAADANAACQDYLLRTWPRDQFSLYEIGASPQQPELSKVSAQINTDRFHVWVERHSWEGTLDFSSKAIAKRAGKGPNAYILQRTIKDASGGKRRSTTRGIFATYQLAKQALAQEQPPSEWSSNEGYVVETHGEYAHALSPSGKTAWLFIEIRPLYMTYQPMDQEEQEQLHAQGASSSHIGTSASHPISLDHGDDSITGTPVASIPPSPSFDFSIHRSGSLRPFHLDNPSSPMQSNPDEAGAFVYLVLQLKTIPYTPPILTVEAVAYEIEVANRVGIALLEGFGGPAYVFEPILREDGCLQGTIELRSRDEGLTVWVEKRAVVLGELDLELLSEPGSIPSNLNKLPHSPLRTHYERDIISTPSSALGLGSHKREEPEGGFDDPMPISPQAKTARISKKIDGRFKVVESTHSTLSTIATSATATSSEATATTTEDIHRSIVDSSEEVTAAVLKARVRFYHSVTNCDLDAVEIQDELDKEDVRTIQAKSRSNPSLFLLKVKVQEGPASE